MTPQEIEALTAAELAAELGWDPRILTTLTHRKHLLTQVRDATAHATALYPTEALETPESLAHDIASGTDWSAGSAGWQFAYDLALILLRAYAPEDP